MSLNYYEVEELACKFLGLDYDSIDANTEIIEEKLSDEYYIDLSIFSDIVSKLLPLIDVGKSPLTDELYKGFSSEGIWLVKMKVENKKEYE